MTRAAGDSGSPLPRPALMPTETSAIPGNRQFTPNPEDTGCIGLLRTSAPGGFRI